MATSKSIVTISTVAGNFALVSYASDGAFVAAKGSSAVAGDVYYNSTFSAMREYQGSAWRTVSSIRQLAAKTTTYSVSIDDEVITGDATGAGFTATLPTAVGNGGKVFTLKKIDTSANAFTVGTTSSQTFDNAGTTFVLAKVNEFVSVMSDNANWKVIAGSKAPTIQKFTSGTGTYTTPTTPKPRWLHVRMAGPGGGGGGGTANDGNAGSADTAFGDGTAGKGSGGVNGGGGGGAGGTGSLGTGWIGIVFPGGKGGGGQNRGALTENISGGNGGTNPLGGAGMAAASSDGSAGAANTGAGGGGGSPGSALTGGGGGAGAYIDAIITTPSATYSYAVGAGGAGGSAGGNKGGDGAAGLIIVEEYY